MTPIDDALEHLLDLGTRISIEHDPAWMGEWEVHIGVGAGLWEQRNPIGYASDLNLIQAIQEAIQMYKQSEIEVTLERMAT
jgi:hypothetical protein